MTCKIKFNNPILDELPTNFATYEEYHNQLVAKLDALYSYFNNDNTDLGQYLLSADESTSAYTLYLKSASYWTYI